MAVAVLCLLSSITFADQAVAPASAAAGSLTETKVTASALKGNLLGDPIPKTWCIRRPDARQ
jgi:hypothetical protein